MGLERRSRGPRRDYDEGYEGSRSAIAGVVLIIAYVVLQVLGMVQSVFRDFSNRHA